MIFNLLTFLAALSTAGVAEWFSIVGIISIYAGAPYHAGLVLGVVLGFAKLVSTSWLYRNWDIASWKIKVPLIYFLMALMMATSMGVFGFLTKSHLEQGADTVNNSAKVERLDQQIAREKSLITDNEKVIAQLDTAINSYIGKNRTDRALSIRRSQAPQRKQLRSDIDASQQRIDAYSDDKLKLTSEVRALALEVGPIRYIAELFYGTDGDRTAKVESAVKMFTLLIVSTLDPLAIILLIAANHTLMRRQNEKKEKAGKKDETGMASTAPDSQPERADVASSAKEETNSLSFIEHTGESNQRVDDKIVFVKAHQDTQVDEKSTTPNPEHGGDIDEEKEVNIEPAEKTECILATVPDADSIEMPASSPSQPDAETMASTEEAQIYTPLAAVTMGDNVSTLSAPSIIRSPKITRVGASPKAEQISGIKHDTTPVLEDAVLRELRGHSPHFIPQKINEETKQKQTETYSHDNEALLADRDTNDTSATATSTPKAVAGTPPETIQAMEKSGQGQAVEDLTHPHSIQVKSTATDKPDKYPVRLSWINEFRSP